MVQYVLPRELLFDRIADGDGYIVSKMQDVPASGTANIHISSILLVTSY